MKITRQQELDYIVSITAGLLASGHFTYVRRDNNGAVVHDDIVRAVDGVWQRLADYWKIEVVDDPDVAAKSSESIARRKACVTRFPTSPKAGASLASQPGGTLKTEARKGK